MSFMRLQKKIDETKNPTVLGIDPALGNIPPPILDKHIAEHGETLDAAGLAVIEYSINIIDGLSGIIPAIKLQSAYFEQLGPRGASALNLICGFARTKDLYIIIDGKRGDIGTTAEAYARAYLGTIKIGNTEITPYDADALTINAYLGSDGIKPFAAEAEKHGKAVFALVKTSNPSSGELQDRIIKSEENAQVQEDLPLYTAVGDLIGEISSGMVSDGEGFEYACIGAVVGATYPRQLRELRERLNHTFFLVPGYGAQGGGADDVKYAFDDNGKGAIVNNSRGITAAWKKEEYRGTHYVDAAREEAVKMRDALRRVLGQES